MILHVPDIYKKKKPKFKDRVTLNLDPTDYRKEAIPLVGTAKLVWMIVAFASIFFGVNFYGMLWKLEISRSFRNFAAVKSNERKRKNKKLLNLMITAAALSLILALVFEKIFFDFGREDNMTRLRMDSIEERSVSVSICFDLCKIIKKEFKSKMQSKCDEEELMKSWTIRELDERTWNASDFKKLASIKNGARPYPIRQEDFPIPRFFRDLKKCFLLYYEGKNYWPHFSMQRFSRIYINIDGNVLHTHFFIEDGYSYPKIEATPTNISVIHTVELEKRRLRDGCVDYLSSFGKSKDRLIRQCIVKESLK